MKTIKQIADEIGVSKQAVHQKRKSKELSTALQSFTTTVDGIVYISIDGEILIKQAFGGYDRKVVDVNEPTTVDALVSMLQKELDTKNKLIDEQQQTINKLTDTLKAQAEGNAAEKKNVLAETLIDGQKILHDGGVTSPAGDPPPMGFIERVRFVFGGNKCVIKVQ